MRNHISPGFRIKSGMTGVVMISFYEVVRPKYYTIAVQEKPFLDNSD